ncbi:phenylacetate--CoA ligase family protein [Lutibacter sp. A64]|uniref:phenylacetate--CoA ligase family protein n=1 Tax=Lutibacter sp. A64 TaxID=2918526 RepID=UPI001F05F71B|nr:phenylacetate--CoA ligase family protein [Lutibacter sp. A64]UMB55459.1 phenylacetate--CoA ligase family protein [Lutibacter sp. A64]
MKEKIYNFLPNIFQNILISAFNIFLYRKRYGGKYNYYLKQFTKNNKLTIQELKEIQTKKYEQFITSSVKKSNFYKSLYSAVVDFQSIKNIEQLPIVNKEMLRSNIDSIHTIAKAKGIVSKTGGTTGKSLEVIFSKDNMQERFAMLDNFRGNFGYRLGKKTAWFSGKNLLTQSDVNKNRFWKTDYWHKVRYYSTFHIKDAYLHYYVKNLIKYKPEYLVGFPSSILEIAKFGLINKYHFPEATVKAIFPTAETVTNEMRQVIETFFKTKMYNQYASSEGAPFIIECSKGNLHLELQSGVFEVLDEQDMPCKKGRLVVTSFTTYGTPLIRYDIGDSIELSDEVCTCGNNNPLVKEILGRVDDFIYSPKNGKINLGNISNTLKDTNGIVKFQVIQNFIDTLDISIIIDEHHFTKETETVFLKNWRDRVGLEMKINLNYVKKIDVEKSGKFRMVRNNIKHLILKNETNPN